MTDIQEMLDACKRWSIILSPVILMWVIFGISHIIYCGSSVGDKHWYDIPYFITCLALFIFSCVKAVEEYNKG
jgi:hypothetical protein